MRGIKRLIGSGVYIPVSRLSVAVSAVLGVPGVTLLVLLSLL